jgi:hypothetical protein
MRVYSFGLLLSALIVAQQAVLAAEVTVDLQLETFDRMNEKKPHTKNITMKDGDTLTVKLNPIPGTQSLVPKLGIVKQVSYDPGVWTGFDSSGQKNALWKGQATKPGTETIAVDSRGGARVPGEYQGPWMLILVDVK